jgi:hypothetical protein
MVQQRRRTVLTVRMLEGKKHKKRALKITKTREKTKRTEKGGGRDEESSFLPSKHHQQMKKASLRR